MVDLLIMLGVFAAAFVIGYFPGAFVAPYTPYVYDERYLGRNSPGRPDGFCSENRFA
jgi:hypothetical protein